MGIDIRRDDSDPFDRSAMRHLRIVRPPVEEIVRWTAFLDQGGAGSPSRRQSVAALLEAAEYDEEILHAAWTCSLRALRLGSVTRSSCDLLYAALNECAIASNEETFPDSYPDDNDVRSV